MQLPKTKPVDAGPGYDPDKPDDKNMFTLRVNLKDLMESIDADASKLLRAVADSTETCCSGPHDTLFPAVALIRECAERVAQIEDMCYAEPISVSFPDMLDDTYPSERDELAYDNPLKEEKPN